MAEICQNLGWTIQEYESQPQWFIDLILTKIEFKNRQAEEAEREAERQHKKYGS